MKNFWRAQSLLLLTAGILLIGTHEATAAGTSGAQFLKLGAGARATAMGDAFSAAADDVSAAYWNPAGLSRIEEAQISLMQTDYLVDTQYQYFGAALPMNNGAMGFSLYRLDHGSIDRYNASDVKEGSFDAGSLAAAMTVSSRQRNGWSYGVTFKFLQETLDTEKATAFAGDAGLHRVLGATTLSASIHHVGSKMTFVKESFSLPQTLRFGAAHRFFDGKMLLAADLSKPNDNDASVNGGVEYKVNSVLALRGGYHMTPGNSLDVDGLTGLTGGVGVNLGRFSMDYAFAPFGDLGSTHRFSLLIKFDRPN